MHTTVTDGEPVVYGDAYEPSQFRALLTEADREPPQRVEEVREQIAALHRAVRIEGYRRGCDDHERLPINVTQRVFQFVADECCNEDKRYTDTTIHVMKKSKWGSHMGWTRVRGCRCRKCGDDPYLLNSVAFLNEVGHVRFEI
jgi:hypothetical protein